MLIEFHVFQNVFQQALHIFFLCNLLELSMKEHRLLLKIELCH